MILKKIADAVGVGNILQSIKPNRSVHARNEMMSVKSIAASFVVVQVHADDVCVPPRIAVNQIRTHTRIISVAGEFGIEILDFLGV